MTSKANIHTIAKAVEDAQERLNFLEACFALKHRDDYTDIVCELNNQLRELGAFIFDIQGRLTNALMSDACDMWNKFAKNFNALQALAREERLLFA